LTPQAAVIVVGQQLVAPLALEQSSRLAAQGVNDMAEINLAAAALPLRRSMTPGQHCHRLVLPADSEAVMP
jgi:hypothetical protein